MTWQDNIVYLVNSESEIDYTKESRFSREDIIKRNNLFHKKKPKSLEYYKNLLTSKESDTISKNETNKGSNVTKSEKTEKANKKKLSKNSSQATLMFNSLMKIYRKMGYFLMVEENRYEKIQVFKHYSTSFLNDKGKEVSVNVNACLGEWTGFYEVLKSDSSNFTGFNESLKVWIHLAEKEYKIESDIQVFFNSLINDSRITEQMKKYIINLENRLRLSWTRASKQPYGFKAKGLEVFNAWLYEAQEVDHIKEIETSLNLATYENTFPLARELKRHFYIFVGPTNSGKTHAALNVAQTGANGYYLAPLRLMAAEGQEALADRGIVANLVTGEEQQLIPYATHTSSTVEMCNLNHAVDVAVIDEIQMIADPARGWAWTQAVVGVPAKKVVLVGSDEALPILIPLIEQLGETYEIQNFERKTPLKVREPLGRVGDLKANDCVVVFSRKSALEMKAQIEASGKKCSVIYGNLSPEVRRAEAAKFKSGENPILVATDAIGMGLNLPIQRIFFSTMEKYDGSSMRPLHVTEVKQIAGRAGRYGLAQLGEVGLLLDGSQADKDLLTRSIYKGHAPLSDTRAAVAPNLQQIEKICDVIEKRSVYSALIFFREKLIRENDIYKTANLEAMIELANILRSKSCPLDIEFTYSCVPIDPDVESQYILFNRWVNSHMRGLKNTPPELPEEMEISPRNISGLSLYIVENYVKVCMAYRWLHYKFPDVYTGLEQVIENAKKANTYIEKALEKSIAIKQMVSKVKIKK